MSISQDLLCMFSKMSTFKSPFAWAPRCYQLSRAWSCGLQDVNLSRGCAWAPRCQLCSIAHSLVPKDFNFSIERSSCAAHAKCVRCNCSLTYTPNYLLFAQNYHPFSVSSLKHQHNKYPTCQRVVWHKWYAMQLKVFNIFILPLLSGWDFSNQAVAKKSCSV